MKTHRTAQHAKMTNVVSFPNVDLCTIRKFLDQEKGGAGARGCGMLVGRLYVRRSRGRNVQKD